MSIDPYHPTQDHNPHSPLPGKPDPLGPGQIELNPEHASKGDRLPGDAQRRPTEHERGGVERVIGGSEHAERSAPPSSR